MAFSVWHMLSRRYSVSLALVIAAACGVAVFVAAISRDSGAASSATAVAGSFVGAGASPEALPTLPRVQVEDGPQPSAFLRPPRANETHGSRNRCSPETTVGLPQRVF